jgi:DUF4097 and DUF4098 domain-containing protein YvlB
MYLQVVIATTLLFCFSYAETQELRKEGRYFVTDITKSFTVSGAGALRIYDIRGDVSITGWDKQEVLIKERKQMDVFTREEAETVLQKSASSYRQSGNDIEIGGENFSRDWIKSKFEVQLPFAFSADIQTRGGDISVEQINGEVELKTSGGDIELSELGGTVSAVTSGGDITVNSSTGDVTLKTSGGDLQLQKIGGVLIAKTSGGDISLEKAGNRVELHTSGGDIAILDVNSHVKAHTSGGDIEIESTAGDVEVHTSGGDIVLANIGGKLEASTSGGDVQGDGIMGQARVATSGGSIELHDVQGGVEAKTAGGDIVVKITLQDFNKPHSVDLRTAGGEIELYIPEKLPATIRAEIENSSRWETYRIYSDFPIRITDDASEGKRNRRRFITGEGEINGGGDLIELYTTNGDISIKKLDR